MNSSVEILIRTIVAYAWLWTYTKLIGRQLITHGSYNSFVLSIVLGTIAGNMAFNLKIETIYFLISLLVISGIGYTLMKLSLNNNKAGKIISGEATVIIKDGIVLEENMKKCKYSLASLQQGLRNKDIFDIDQVEFAMLEINGTLSVLKKAEYRSMTLKDLKAYFPDRHFPPK